MIYDESQEARSTLAELLDVDPDTVLSIVRSRSRTKPFVVVRVFLARLLYKEGWTQERIGELMDRDHSTIVHYLRHWQGPEEMTADSLNTWLG